MIKVKVNATNDPKSLHAACMLYKFLKKEISKELVEFGVSVQIDNDWFTKDDKGSYNYEFAIGTIDEFED